MNRRSPIARRAAELTYQNSLPSYAYATALALDERKELNEPVAHADAWAYPDTWREAND